MYPGPVTNAISANEHGERLFGLTSLPTAPAAVERKQTASGQLGGSQMQWRIQDLLKVWARIEIGSAVP